MSSERRKQFTFYASYFDTVMSLPKRRQWPTMLALIRYALEGAEPEEGSLYSPAVFKGIRPNIDSSRTKAEQKLREKRARRQEELWDGTPEPRPAPEVKEKNKYKTESEKEREEENKNETKKKRAPAGAPQGTAAPAGAPDSPALSERESSDIIIFNEAEPTGDGEAGEGPDPREVEALEPFAAMLREDGALARVWEEYRQLGSDGLGPPSGAERLVVLSGLAALPQPRRASSLRARLARGGG